MRPRHIPPNTVSNILSMPWTPQPYPVLMIIGELDVVVVLVIVTVCDILYQAVTFKESEREKGVTALNAG